jgi:preprotein translocase subunit YajC
VRRGATVWTSSGERGKVVSKSNGTVYVQLDDGRFERLLVSDIHPEPLLAGGPAGG